MADVLEWPTFTNEEPVDMVGQTTVPLGVEYSNTEVTPLGVYSPGQSLVNLFVSLLFPLSILALFVFWIIALVGAITRHDLKNHRALWIIFLIFTGPIGLLLYFFLENRKKFGIISIILMLLPLLSFVILRLLV